MKIRQRTSPAPRLRRHILGLEALLLIALVAALFGVRGNFGATVLPAPLRQQEAAVRNDAATTGASEAAAAPSTTARRLAELDQLAVKGRAPKTGYSREKFGQRWSDDVAVEFGHNGCDTRNDILRRDITDPVIKDGTNGCVVLSGTLTDPYSGAAIDFRRGNDSSAAVQIDHVVALSDAWQKGAQDWDADTRRNFANDPRNLRAVGGGLNQAKGDGDAATWLPPNKAYRCDYAAAIVEVKHVYSLWVTPAEKDALRRVLSTC